MSIPYGEPATGLRRGSCGARDHIRERVPEEAWLGEGKGRDSFEIA
jgi:hypothetical protein